MKLKTKNINDNSIIYLFGRMDIIFVETIEEEYMNLLQNVKTKSLILDLSDVTYLSSSAIRIFSTTMKYCKEKSIRLSLTGLNESARKIFDLVEILPLLDVYKSVDEAVYKSR